MQRHTGGVSVVCSEGDELLPTVDVVRRAGERRVGHDVDGERGDVGGTDDAAELTRTGASSSASAAVNGGSAAGAAETIPRP